MHHSNERKILVYKQNSDFKFGLYYCMVSAVEGRGQGLFTKKPLYKRKDESCCQRTLGVGIHLTGMHFCVPHIQTSRNIYIHES